MQLFEIALPDCTNSGDSYCAQRLGWEALALKWAGDYTVLGERAGAWRDPDSGIVYEEMMHGYQVACDVNTMSDLVAEVSACSRTRSPYSMPRSAGQPSATGERCDPRPVDFVGILHVWGHRGFVPGCSLSYRAGMRGGEGEADRDGNSDPASLAPHSRLYSELPGFAEVRNEDLPCYTGGADLAALIAETREMPRPTLVASGRKWTPERRAAHPKKYKWNPGPPAGLPERSKAI